MSDQSTIKKLPLEQRIFLHRELVATGILPSCVNCTYGAPRSEMAEVTKALVERMYCDKFAGYPPLNVVAYGCPGWEQAIPF